MKALFNGKCDECRMFRPRCAYVWITVVNTFPKPAVLCDRCRGREWRGRFRLDIKHR